MTAWWTRYEGPTWIVAIAIYAGWLALAAMHRALSPWLLIPCAVYVTAWHASFQHETIHAMRRVPRGLRTAIAYPPLGMWFPYEVFRRDHLRHHAVRDLTGPGDPESAYFEAETWRAMPSAVRALFRADRSLVGRVTIGPALLLWRTYARAIARLRGGDRSDAAMWLRHLGAIAAVLLLLHVFAGIEPLAYLAFVAYPALALGLVRSFAEHRRGEAGERTTTVVSRSALSLLFLNNNFHATHHENPSLPWYAIPRAWNARAAEGRSDAVRGYREVARRWLLRPIDEPVRGSAPNVQPRAGSARKELA